jgi:hypothetical protein
VENSYRSKFAKFVTHSQDVTDRKNPKAFGVMLHTTGRGVLDAAKARGITPMEWAIRVYTARGAFFPHYVVQDKVAWQIADERERAAHCGLPAMQRAHYMNGSWRRAVSPEGLALWNHRWPGVRCPPMLYPSRYPNEDYIGIEIIPQPDATFSADSIATAATLTADILRRHGVKWAVNVDPKDDKKVIGTRQIVGHEDIEPLERWDAIGGWDPGALRAKPRWDWSRFMALATMADIEQMEAGIEPLPQDGEPQA